MSRAAGIEIVKTQGGDAGCSYIAKGDPADMTSKHMTAMLSSQTKARGETPDPKAMQMAQQIAGGFFKQQEQSDKNLSAAAATGEVVILTVSFTSGNASLEMKLNRAAFNHIAQTGPVSSGTDSTAATGTGNLNGIGDEAYAMGGTGMIVRKGNTVAHFMFPECPCSTDAVKPLAKRVADQL